ncbi:dihydropteroate synthase [Thermodesulfovibrio sp. 3907-1M]|uniref:Dihydropteroate synthase n=1 Tax=Thermodesulfovibrio autotrophicus TaxID=3118333 RepID=A0AAU8H1W2_9BACT
MLIIGERLTIISKRVREAILKRDKLPIQQIAIEQWKAGAHMIEANIGPAEDDGEALMEWMVTTIQEAVPLPVSLDTTNPKAMEAGLRIHNNEWGKPLINSTSLDPERFIMFELAAKYAAPIIALTVGKGGLPRDAEERVEIAVQLMEKATEYGIELEDIFLDPLVLQISTSQHQAKEVLRAVKLFQELNDPPMKTIVGLSNLSNGCPRQVRPILNRYFLALLMYEGLSAAIVNPSEVIEVVKTVNVITGKTLYAHSYLEI